LVIPWKMHVLHQSSVSRSKLNKKPYQQLLIFRDYLNMNRT